MLRLVQTEVTSSDEGTLSALCRVDGSRVCYMLELPERHNAPNRSRIPAGVYRVDYLRRSASGRFKDCYHVQGVAGRSGILIHKANFAGDIEKGWQSHLLGCLAPAKAIGKLKNIFGNLQLAGLDSAGGLSALHVATGRGSFILDIRR